MEVCTVFVVSGTDQFVISRSLTSFCHHWKFDQFLLSVDVCSVFVVNGNLISFLSSREV